MFTERLRARVAGMTSQHSVHAVFTSLTPVDGILSAEVALGVVEIEHDGRVTTERLREAIAVAGYEVIDVESIGRSLPIL